MTINNATMQDQLSEEEFNRIYMSRKSVKFNPSAGYDSANESDQRLGRFIDKLDQIFGMCMQDPDYTVNTDVVNPSIELAITSLPQIASGSGIPKIEKIFEYYRRVKLFKLISKLVELDAEKKDELYIAEMKLDFKKLVKNYIELLKEYKKQHKLNIGLEQIEIVVDDAELVEEGKADQFVNEVVEAPILEATLKSVQDGLESNTQQNFIPAMRLTYEFKKSEQKLADHIGVDAAKKIIEKHNKEVQGIIQSSSDRNILEPASNLFNVVSANHPNSMTPVFLEKILATAPPEAIALVQKVMAMAPNDEYMAKMSRSIDARLQSESPASALEPRRITPFDPMAAS